MLPLPSNVFSQNELLILSLFKQLTPEMEKMLVQQVLGMSAEQINMLPPEQRQQVLQLRDMLRQ